MSWSIFPLCSCDFPVFLSCLCVLLSFAVHFLSSFLDYLLFFCPLFFITFSVTSRFPSSTDVLFLFFFLKNKAPEVSRNPPEIPSNVPETTARLRKCGNHGQKFKMRGDKNREGSGQPAFGIEFTYTNLPKLLHVHMICLVVYPHLAVNSQHSFLEMQRISQSLLRGMSGMPKQVLMRKEAVGKMRTHSVCPSSRSSECIDSIQICFGMVSGC